MDDFEALLAAEPEGTNAPAALLDLGLAYQGLNQREKARDRYHELANEFPSDASARTALANACEIHAYLEEGPALLAEDHANARMLAEALAHGLAAGPALVVGAPFGAIWAGIF